VAERFAMMAVSFGVSAAVAAVFAVFLGTL